jgi:hypothetical protein
MPERAINTKSATGCLLVLIPAALTMSALFVAWPIILGVTLLIAGGNVWQGYEWSKTTRSIDPVFQQAIVQNRGEITPLDLALNANISGTTAKRYLVTRAAEFGTGYRQDPDRGQVYYFVSVRTLGDIFDDSELELPEIMPATTSVVAFQSTPEPVTVSTTEIFRAELTPLATAAISSLPIAEIERSTEVPLPAASIPSELIPPVTTAATLDLQMPSVSTPSVELPQVSPPIAPVEIHPSSNLQQLFDDRQTAVEIPAVPAEIAAVESVRTPDSNLPIVTIVQSELAKRLDVHPSTIYKRRSEPNFTDWTRNRDPEGIAWGYAESAKEYYRIDT